MTDAIRTEFLVYGECVCGWRMAAPAGARWPFCPVCKRRVMPALPASDVPRYGYVAELHPEQDAYLDERCEITDADDTRRDQSPEDGPLTIKLGLGTVGYCMFTSAQLEQAEREREEDQARIALSNWRWGSLQRQSWRRLPWAKRFRPRTAPRPPRRLVRGQDVRGRRIGVDVVMALPRRGGASTARHSRGAA